MSNEKRRSFLTTLKVGAAVGLLTLGMTGCSPAENITANEVVNKYEYFSENDKYKDIDVSSKIEEIQEKINKGQEISIEEAKFVRDVALDLGKVIVLDALGNEVDAEVKNTKLNAHTERSDGSVYVTVILPNGESIPIKNKQMEKYILATGDLVNSTGRTNLKPKEYTDDVKAVLSLFDDVDELNLSPEESKKGKTELVHAPEQKVAER